ncbi:alpha/beta-hydrolase [Apiospora arundinis]
MRFILPRKTLVTKVANYTTYNLGLRQSKLQQLQLRSLSLAAMSSKTPNDGGVASTSRLPKPLGDDPGNTPNAVQAARVDKTQAPYGQWKSEISKEALFRGSRKLLAPRVCSRSGWTFFIEGRPDGIYYLVEAYQTESGEYGCRTVLPAGYSARSRVYEYGGGAYAILGSTSSPISGADDDDGLRIIFSNFSDCTVQILNVDTKKVTCLLEKSDTLRYADFAAHPSPHLPWVLAVQEDHASSVPDQVKNYIVAIHTVTGEIRRLVHGADFYMYPSFSPDGKKVAWVQWDFPDMPWSGVTVYWADWDDLQGVLTNTEWVAGKEAMTVTEPRWGCDGSLYFCYEKTNYRQFYRRRPDEKESMLLDFKGHEEAEFGSASMFIGSHTYATLSKNCVIAVATENGTDTVIAFDPETLKTRDLSLPLSEITYDGLYRLSDTSFLVIGSGNTTPQALYRVDIIDGDESAKKTSAQLTKFWNSNDVVFNPEIFSKPQHIRFPAKSGPERDIHGFYWPPHNPKYESPEGTKPPLIVQSHGGPTGHTGPGLNMSMQYWNSRGYATFAINYSGSDGHGKRYRELLNGRWGAIDVDDIAESVRYLSSESFVDGHRVGIRGGSAGGYSVLQALCHYPDLFAGGACYYGISDVKLLLQETHKMESHYVDFLLFTPDMTESDKEKVMRDRSPVYHAGNITAPLLICHGEEDKVVPISQAYTMYDDIRARGGEVRLVKFPGEGHGFRKGENLLKAHEEEEEWWKKTIARSD